MISTLYKMADINTTLAIPKHFNYLLVACGIDNRAYEVLRKLLDLNVKIDNVIVFDYLERKEGLSKKDNAAYYSYKDLRIKIIQISCSLKDPSSCIKQLNENNYFSSNRIMGIDISCFTKPFFFLIIKLLELVYAIKQVSVFYTEPKSYVFAKGLYDSPSFQ